MTAPFLNPREEPASGRGRPPLAVRTAARAACRAGRFPCLTGGERGESRPLRPRLSAEKPMIAMAYAKPLRAGIRCNNGSVTGGDFALIRAITGGVLAITGKSPSGRRKRAGGFENGFAGGLAGAG